MGGDLDERLEVVNPNNFYDKPRVLNMSGELRVLFIDRKVPRVTDVRGVILEFDLVELGVEYRLRDLTPEEGKQVASVLKEYSDNVVGL